MVYKYHIVFTPKDKYYELRADIQKIIQDFYKWKGIEMIESDMTPDHALKIPLKISVSQSMGY